MNDFKVGDLVCWKCLLPLRQKQQMGIIINRYYDGREDFVKIFWLDIKQVLPAPISHYRLKKLK